MSTDTAEYVTKIEAARRLGISTRQLDRLVLDRKLTKYTRIVGRHRVHYRASDLDDLLRIAAENG
jgi:hypothetical protein